MTRPAVVLHSKPHRHYTIDGERTTPTGEQIVSVTQVLGILDKPALVGWAAKVTAEGCWRLARRKGYELPDQPWKFTKDLKRFGLDHRSTTGEAALRGTTIHAALEDWITRRKLPTPSAHPPAWGGYFRALSGFLMWVHNEGGEFVESELAVGSLTHGFAGTRDTVCTVATKAHGRVMYDLKTSKRVYPGSHFPQLAAYEIAGVECGEQPTDRQAIVRLGSDGVHEIAWSVAMPDDFLAILECFRQQRALIKRAEVYGR